MRNRWLYLFALAVAFGCGDDDPSGTPEQAQNAPPPTALAKFTLPDDLGQLAGETFFDHPWPSDFRLEPDGTVRFEGYPNPSAVPLIGNYIDSMDGLLTGFSPVASGFLRFTAPIDRGDVRTGLDERPREAQISDLRREVEGCCAP